MLSKHCHFLLACALQYLAIMHSSICAQYLQYLCAISPVSVRNISSICAQYLRAICKRCRVAGRRVAGRRVAGCRVAGCRVAGCRVAGCRVAGCRVAGCRVAMCWVAGCRVAGTWVARLLGCLFVLLGCDLLCVRVACSTAYVSHDTLPHHTRIILPCVQDVLEVVVLAF